eukprot:6200113-Pleurochrysis_carterae.AAC.1
MPICTGCGAAAVPNFAHQGTRSCRRLVPALLLRCSRAFLTAVPAKAFSFPRFASAVSHCLFHALLPLLPRSLVTLLAPFSRLFSCFT